MLSNKATVNYIDNTLALHPQCAVECCRTGPCDWSSVYSKQAVAELAVRDATMKKIQAPCNAYPGGARKWSVVGGQRFLALREKASG